MLITVARIDSTTKKAVLKDLNVPESTTMEEALKELGLTFSREKTGLWCQNVTPDTVLREGDRIDIASDLVINRVEARRLRAQKSEKPAKALLARHGGKHAFVK